MIWAWTQVVIEATASPAATSSLEFWILWFLIADIRLKSSLAAEAQFQTNKALLSRIHLPGVVLRFLVGFVKVAQLGPSLSNSKRMKIGSG